MAVLPPDIAVAAKKLRVAACACADAVGLPIACGQAATQ